MTSLRLNREHGRGMKHDEFSYPRPLSAYVANDSITFLTQTTKHHRQRFRCVLVVKNHPLDPSSRSTRRQPALARHCVTRSRDPSPSPPHRDGGVSGKTAQRTRQVSERDGQLSRYSAWQTVYVCLYRLDENSSSGRRPEGRSFCFHELTDDLVVLRPPQVRTRLYTA